MEITAACTDTHKTTKMHCVGSTPVLQSDVLNADISWQTTHPDFIVVFLGPIKQIPGPNNTLRYNCSSKPYPIHYSLIPPLDNILSWVTDSMIEYHLKKLSLFRPWRHKEGVQVQLHLALGGHEWSISSPSHFSPGKQPQYTQNRGLGGSQSQSGQLRRRENLVSARNRISDHPDCTESLCHPCCPDSLP
jgi:hypothetical protein